jgi:hypothetical protein
MQMVMKTFAMQQWFLIFFSVTQAVDLATQF